MSHYKNTEIAKEFNVSHVTVMNWIEQAGEKKNNLQLIQVKNKFNVVINEHNKAELKKLSEVSLKHKAKADVAELTPPEKFYSLLSDSQTIEIINTLETKQEIPHKFSYLYAGASYWDEFLLGVSESGSYNYYNQEVEDLQEHYSYLEKELSDYDKINIIDLGAGNSYPVKELLSHFIKTKKVQKYCAVDISNEMLTISESNIKDWFPTLTFEKYQNDLENDTLLDIFYKDRHSSSKEKVVNLILFLGGTYGALGNSKKALDNIKTSMGPDDILVLTNKLDKGQENRVELAHVKDGYELFLWLPELLGFNVENCELITQYNEIEGRRQTTLKLDKTYIINFEVLGTSRRVVLTKNTELILWYHKMSTVKDLSNQLNESGLKMLLIASHSNRATLMSVSKIGK